MRKPLKPTSSFFITIFLILSFGLFLCQITRDYGPRQPDKPPIHRAHSNRHAMPEGKSSR